MATRTAEERLYLDRTRTKVVSAGGDAAFLWKAQGDEITDDEAERYGFGTAEERPSRRSGPPRRTREADDASKSAGSDEDKEAAQGSDKAVAPDENKSA